MTDAQSSTPVPLPAEFNDQFDRWYKAVAAVFARVQKKDVAEIPLDVWKKLIKTTYDGIDVKPLYTRADDEGAAPQPGVFPYVRGAQRDYTNNDGWGVTETFSGDAAEVNKAILHALENGTTDVVLTVNDQLPAADLAKALAGVYVDIAPVRLRAGKKVAEAAAALYEIVEASANPAQANVELGADALTAGFGGCGCNRADFDQVVDLAVDAAARPFPVRAIEVSGVDLSNQGATDAQEIGFATAAGVEYLRALIARGLTPTEALGQVSFRFAATDDQFAQIAKFRAARQVWARVAEVLGAPEAGSAPQHAVTAPVMFSQRDPWVNMLRSTIAAFAAGVGGATDVEVLTFDSAVHGGWPGTSRTFATRIARNTNLLLLEESHLGFVVDPAGGSYFVEALTSQLAEKAWSIFQAVEAKGGFRAAGEYIQGELDQAYATIRADIAHRRKQLTGINEFPNLGEAPLDAEHRAPTKHVRRWATDFEDMRNRSDAFLEANGQRPQIGLIPLGPLAKHNIRTGFTTNLLASGGIEALNPGQVVPGTDEFAAAAVAAPIVVLCGTDAEYGENGQAAVAALRAAGAGKILLAGAPASFEGAEHAPDGYLNLKIDAAATLAGLLEELGA